jgi:hypothetical protein
MTQNPAFRPYDILLDLIVALIAPIFVSTTGDLAQARIAALETVTAYRAENHLSLLAVAKVLAFGLAALGSLSLSMADDISIPLIIRLRANATALDRAGARNERALSQPDAPKARTELDETAVLASIAEAQARAAAAQPKTPAAQPATAAPATAEPAPNSRQAQWAAAMARVAAEDMATIINLPPAERREATVRAAILSSTANALISGTPNAPLDLSAMRRAPQPTRGRISDAP